MRQNIQPRTCCIVRAIIARSIQQNRGWIFFHPKVNGCMRSVRFLLYGICHGEKRSREGKVQMQTHLQKKTIVKHFLRGVNYSEKSLRRFLGIRKSRQFFSGFWDFFPKFKGFWEFFQLIFSKYFPFIPDIFCDI